jgi:hypothetical protein
MTVEEATKRLVQARVAWRSNSGSTFQFNKTEGEIFTAFRRANLDWETTWPQVQLASRQGVTDSI